MKKQRLTAFVSKDVKDKLEAEKDNRSLSNHVEKILIEHVKPKPFMPKKEYE